MDRREKKPTIQLRIGSVVLGISILHNPEQLPVEVISDGIANTMIRRDRMKYNIEHNKPQARVWQDHYRKLHAAFAGIREMKRPEFLASLKREYACGENKLTKKGGLVDYLLQKGWVIRKTMPDNHRLVSYCINQKINDWILAGEL